MSIHLLNADCGGIEKTTQAVGEIINKRSLALHKDSFSVITAIVTEVV